MTSPDKGESKETFIFGIINLMNYCWKDGPDREVLAAASQAAGRVAAYLRGDDCGGPGLSEAEIWEIVTINFAQGFNEAMFDFRVDDLMRPSTGRGSRA